MSHEQQPTGSSTKKTFISVISLTLLAGCANNMTAEQRAELQADRVASVSEPMLTLECSSGCQFDKLELRDPRAISSLPPLATPTNGWDFANQLLRTTTAVAPWVAVTKISTDAISELSDQESNTTITNKRGDTAGGDVVGGDQSGDTRGDVAGDTRGDVAGDTRGDVAGDTRGDVRGDTAGGDIVGGDQSGDTRGDVAGDTRGDTRGDTAGRDQINR